MILIRKADLSFQATIAILTVLCCIILSPFYILIGELLIGIWQLLSATINTPPLLRSPFRGKIITYWIWAASALIIFILIVTLKHYIPEEAGFYLHIISFIHCLAPGIYYWILYKKFIGYLEMQGELSGFTKSKR